jgi:hypothetical protein
MLRRHRWWLRFRGSPTGTRWRLLFRLLSAELGDPILYEAQSRRPDPMPMVQAAVVMLAVAKVAKSDSVTAADSTRR